MHELAITQEILGLVLRHAESAQAKRVTRIELVIGAMTGFVEDSIQFCFAALSQGTIAQGAEIAFHRVSVRLRCRQCGTEFEPEPDGNEWICGNCSSLAGEVIAGREFYVGSIDIEQ